MFSAKYELKPAPPLHYPKNNTQEIILLAPTVSHRPVILPQRLIEGDKTVYDIYEFGQTVHLCSYRHIYDIFITLSEEVLYV